MEWRIKRKSEFALILSMPLVIVLARGLFFAAISGQQAARDGK
jgi:hypothetical protein